MAARQGRVSGEQEREAVSSGVDWPARRVFWVFAGAAALASLVFFASFVTDRGTIIFGTDMLSEAYQSRAFAVQEVQAGRGLPQWNPFIYAGLPFLSILPYPVYYPTSLLYFVIPLHRAIGWAFVLHFLLAGLLAYGLARELRLKPGPAVVTGIAYMFTGYLVSHLYGGQDGRMFAMTWTPALFLLAERAIARRNGHWFLWMAGVAALQVFTPHVQMMYFAAMAVGAYVLFRLVQIRRQDAEWKTVLLLLASFVGAYLLAGLITLVEVWPTLNMVRFSHRAARDYAYASSWAMPVPETLGMIWPAFQGYLRSYWGSNPFKLHTEYVGAVPVLLAVLAVAVQRSARVRFFAGLGVVGLLFAWGSATPVHRIFYWTLPLMRSFRAPSMMYSIVALAVVVLAGHGAQILYERSYQRSGESADRSRVVWRVLAGLGVAWALLWLWAAASPQNFGGFWSDLLYRPLSPQQAAAMRSALPRFVAGFGLFTLYWALGVALCWAAMRRKIAPLAACALLAGLTMVDLWRVDKDFYGTVEISRLDADEAVEYLREQPEPFRVLPLPSAYGSNDLMLHRIETVTGLQKFRLKWWDDLVGEGLSRLRDLRMWRLLDIEYVASGQPLDVPQLELAFQGAGPLVYRWRGDGPRAWVVREAVARPVDVEPAAALLSPSFDPDRTALLEPGVAPPALDSGAAGAAQIEWETRTPDRLALTVDNPGAGLLVLSEVYHPYWSAAVDGEPAPVLQVDVALRGVPVPAGRHRVEMRFADPAVTHGAWGSALGLLILIGLLGLTWPRRGRVDLAATERGAGGGG